MAMSIRKLLKAAVAVVLVSGFVNLFPAAVPSVRAESPQPAGVGNDALEAIGRMSKTLAAKQFSFTSRTLRAYAGPNGELLHIAHTIKTVFSRPDRLSVDAAGDDGSLEILYDGKNLTVYAVEQKKYATVPMTGGIDKALDTVEERTKTDFPLADLLSDDPGASLLSGVTSGGQVGTATIGGVACRHFFFLQASDDLELELWLEDNDRSVPRRMIVTYRSLPGRPNFVAEMSDWDFSIQAPDSAFEFKPPAGVTQVDWGAQPSAASAPQK
jgi:hypothetical protein